MVTKAQEDFLLEARSGHWRGSMLLRWMPLQTQSQGHMMSAVMIGVLGEIH